MNILIDGLVFQYAGERSADARACRAILQELVSETSHRGASVTILDRGGVPPIDDARVIAFPSFRNATPAADAFLMQRLCDRLETDIFVSTGFTAPISTVTLQLLVGEDLDLVEANRSDAASRRDCDIAVAFSRFLVCSTAAMETACRKRFPGLADARLPHSTQARRAGSDMHDDRVRSMAPRIVALSRQALSQDTVLREPDFLRRWRRLREIQAAVEVS